MARCKRDATVVAVNGHQVVGRCPSCGWEGGHVFRLSNEDLAQRAVDRHNAGKRERAVTSDPRWRWDK